MQLIKENNKIYVLLTNAELVHEDYCKYRDRYHIPHGLQKKESAYFQGPQGAFLLYIEEIYEVSRILPYDTTARNYWGEFRRMHKMVPRLNKLMNIEKSYVLECTLSYETSDEEFTEAIEHSYEFNSFVTTIRDEFSFRGFNNGKVYRNKTWNLTNERTLGPNLKDYSINDCYKYYTLL
jgi:hypothetical protein